MPVAIGAQTSSSRCRSTPATPSRQRCAAVRAAAKEVTLLDYGAGNVRSVRNAIKRLGYTIKDVSTQQQQERQPYCR
jgi:glutamine amidotransferase/cyclase